MSQEEIENVQKRRAAKMEQKKAPIAELELLKELKEIMLRIEEKLNK